jgi:diguanylate cyclase (GGDEF)-like protein
MPIASKRGTGSLAALEQKLLQSNKRLAIAARVGGLGAWDYDIKRDLMACDERWYEIMGRDPSGERINTIAKFREVVHPEDRDTATEVDRTARTLLDIDEDYFIQFRIIRPDGEVRWVRSAACIFGDNAGLPVRAVGYVFDITEQRKAEQALRETNAALQEENLLLKHQAMVDPVTNIANRRRLDIELKRACQHAITTGTSLTVAMIRADHFRLYNDHYGRQRGDQALAAIAEAIASAAWRPYDLAARFGGAEFVVLLPQSSAPEAVMQRISGAVASLLLPHGASPDSDYLTVSCAFYTSAVPSELKPSFMLLAAGRQLERT